MGFGPVNTPGSAGEEIKSLAQSALDAAEAAGTLANAAGQTANNAAQSVTNLSNTVAELNNSKQDKVTGTKGQFAGFNASGQMEAQNLPASGVGKSMAGQSVKPTSDTTVTAGAGAEVFNDYRERTYSGTSVSAGNVASGQYSHAEGERTTAIGDSSHAEGVGCKTKRPQAHAEGASCIAEGQASHAEGFASHAYHVASHAEGYYCLAAQIGHAEGFGCFAARDNMLIISAINGNVMTVDTSLSSSFTPSSLVGRPAIITYESYGGLSETTVTAATSTTITVEKVTFSSSKRAVVFVLDESSVSNICSHAEGYNTKAIGIYSHAGGCETIALGPNQTAIGKYNNGSTSSANKFIVGKGSSVTSRANCFRVTDTGIYSSGAHNSTGADYAELFEWQDGNPDKEDRSGLFVTLDGEQIRLAGPEDDYILGVISGNPSVVGDVHDDQWQGMYLYDIFGRPIWEDVEVPDETIEEPDPENPEQTITRVIIPAHTEHRQKLNPDYDGTQKYVPRSQRPEWGCVGMLGKLVLIDDGSCQVNGWCWPGEGGIATASEQRTKYRVMSRLDENHVRIMILV